MGWKRARVKAGRLELLFDLCKNLGRMYMSSILWYIRLRFGSWSFVCAPYCIMFFYSLHTRYPEHTLYDPSMILSKETRVPHTDEVVTFSDFVMSTGDLHSNLGTIHTCFAVELSYLCSLS